MRRQTSLLLFVCLLLVSAGAPATLAQSAETGPAEVELLPNPIWVVAIESATLRSQPDMAGEPFGTLRPLAPLQVLGYAADWAYVYNPRTRGTAYVQSERLAPGDAPSAYVEAEAPPAEAEEQRTGWVRDATPLAFYPTDDPSARYTELPAGVSIAVTARVRGDDGQEWYRTADGDYLPVGAVTFPSPPSAPALGAAPAPSLAGRWLDVNLSLPARITAYQGSTAVRSMAPVIGRGPMTTPTGTFSVIRRVANETMDSATIGIPRNSAGGYYLTGVLFTQYFLPTGQSIHYNYWSSNWGYPGSHGCLGLSYSDAAYAWNFATVGTPVRIHY